MAVRVYRWDDSSAPSLTGEAGKLVALLDACLVNGYGSKTAAGWAKTYSATNKAVYRAASGVRHYLRVDDTGTTNATVRAYQSMSDVDTGTDAYPTTAQVSDSNAKWWKSQAASSTARPWIVVADDKRAWVYVKGQSATTDALSTTTTYNHLYFFGEFASYLTGDTDNSALITTSASSGDWTMAGLATNAAAVGHYMATNAANTVASQQFSKHSSALFGGSIMGTHTPAYASAITGGMFLSPVYIIEPTLLCRGRLPGIYDPLHSKATLPAGDTFSGRGPLAGKTFLILPVTHGATADGARVVLETSDTW